MKSLGTSYIFGMGNKKVLATLAIGATVVLSGCAQTIVPGLGLEKASGFEDNRDSLVIEAAVKDAKTGELKPGNITVTQDQMDFDGNRKDFGPEESYFKVVTDEGESVSGHLIRVVVQANDPEAEVLCAIKDITKEEPTHATESEGEGSATCQIDVS